LALDLLKTSVNSWCLGETLEILEANSALYIEFVWTPVEWRHTWKLLEPRSFDVWKKTKAPIIVILNYLEVNMEISNISIETMGFSKCREMSRANVIANGILTVSQTSFSLYLHNQWTDFYKLSCAGKPQMRAIRIYVECTKVTTNDWDIRPSVAVKASSANISWTAERIRTVELALESAHQSVSNDIWCISKQ